MRSRARVFAILAASAAATGIGWTLAGKTRAQASDYDLSITIADVMDAIVVPESEVVWNSISYESTADGGVEAVGPRTEEGWLALRRGALALAESANSLVIPGRPADSPDAVAAEGSLSPAEIDALIESNRVAWVAYANVLRSAAMQAVEATDSRDIDRIVDAGDSLYTSCEGCHQTFWYPQQ